MLQSIGSGMTEQLNNNNNNIRNKIQLFKATGLSRIQNHVPYKEKKDKPASDFFRADRGSMHRRVSRKESVIH